MAEIYGAVSIWDSTNPETPYYTTVDIKESITMKNPVVIIYPMNTEYPTAIGTSKQHGMSGSVTGNFSDNTSGECSEDYAFENDTSFKLTMLNWLVNGRTKYLKLSEDLIIPVAINADVTWEINSTIDAGYETTISFEWVQIHKEQTATSSLIQCTQCNATLVPNAYYCHMCGIQVR